MVDNVKPIRPEVPVHASTLEKVMEDLAGFVECVNTREYQPRFGVVTFVDARGAICTHVLGTCRNYELVGVLQHAVYLYNKSVDRDQDS